MEDSYVEAVLGTLKTAERHIDSEYVDDHAETLASVSREPRYAMMPEPGVVRVISDYAGVAKFYEDARAAFIPGASRIVAQIATDWYVFLENVPTRISAVTGGARTLHTATLFPKAPDGIRGEFLWERSGALADRDVGRSGDVSPLSVRNLQVHETVLRSLCAGDFSRLGLLLEDNCIWAERNYLSDAEVRPMLELQGPQAVVDSLRQWRERFVLERVSILNRLVTDWYVFAEELVVAKRIGDADRCQCRKASIYPVSPEGKIQGMLSYGTEVEAAGPSTDRTLGAAFWERIDPSQSADPLIARR